MTEKHELRSLQLGGAALDAANIGICVSDAEGKFAYANNAFCNLTGWCAGELPGTRIDAIGILLEPPEKSTKAMANRYGGIGRDGELRLKRKDGREIWVHVSSRLLDMQDPSRGAVHVVSDITRRKRLEDSLQRTLSEREVVLQSTLFGVTYSVENRHYWVNSTFAQMLGYAPEELVGASSEIHFRNREHFLEFTNTAHALLASGKPYSSEIQLKRKDGALIWCLAYGNAIDHEDPTKATIWTFLDVTERRALQENLRQSLTERDVILKSALVGISFAANRRHLWVNDTLERMLGYAKGELVGKSSQVHFPDQASWEKFGKDAYPVLASGRPYSTERLMKRKDGSTFWCQLSGNALDPNDLSKGSIWTNIDITERKRAEEETRIALERERELNEMKTRFVSMTSHEFRTPLATILSSVELIEQYSDRLPASEKAEILGSIKVAVKRMTGMLENILMIGKADSGHFAFEPAPLNLRELCQRVIEEVRTTASAVHEFKFNCIGDCERGSMDERLVRHILTNLLSNAVKYSPQGGTIGFELANEGGAAVITVSDAGIGIPVDDLPRLFESFHRGGNVSNIQGTGLGLTIVKKSVDMHGGRIEVHSEERKGTRFTVTLPLKRTQA
jgi:PAS domain S-box-containing protein